MRGCVCGIGMSSLYNIMSCKDYIILAKSARSAGFTSIRPQFADALLPYSTTCFRSILRRKPAGKSAQSQASGVSRPCLAANSLTQAARKTSYSMSFASLRSSAASACSRVPRHRRRKAASMDLDRFPPTICPVRSPRAAQPTLRSDSPARRAPCRSATGSGTPTMSSRPRRR